MKRKVIYIGSVEIGFEHLAVTGDVIEGQGPVGRGAIRGKEEDPDHMKEEEVVVIAREKAIGIEEEEDIDLIAKETQDNSNDLEIFQEIAKKDILQDDDQKIDNINQGQEYKSVEVLPDNRKREVPLPVNKSVEVLPDSRKGEVPLPGNQNEEVPFPGNQKDEALLPNSKRVFKNIEIVLIVLTETH
jgi:hypothetical protein